MGIVPDVGEREPPHQVEIGVRQRLGSSLLPLILAAIAYDPPFRPDGFGFPSGGAFLSEVGFIGAGL